MWNLYTMRYTDINYLIVNIFHDRTESINKQNGIYDVTGYAIIAILILQPAHYAICYIANAKKKHIRHKQKRI